jgi:hypothetical protein
MPTSEQCRNEIAAALEYNFLDLSFSMQCLFNQYNVLVKRKEKGSTLHV